MCAEPKTAMKQSCICVCLMACFYLFFVLPSVPCKKHKSCGRTDQRRCQQRDRDTVISCPGQRQRHASVINENDQVCQRYTFLIQGDQQISSRRHILKSTCIGTMVQRRAIRVTRISYLYCSTLRHIRSPVRGRRNIRQTRAVRRQCCALHGGLRF